VTVGRTLLGPMLYFPVLVPMVFLLMFFVLTHRRGAPSRVDVDRNNKIPPYREATANLRARPTAMANRGRGAMSIIRDEAELRARPSIQAPNALFHGRRYRASVIRLPRYGSLERLAPTLLQAASGRR
jgi:hypothetical protein